MELHEAITKVHESLEGRYDLNGYDLHEIHGLLCDMQNSNMNYIVVNIGCIECGVSSNIVGIFDNKEKAESIVAKCKEKYYWREHGQNSFEIFEMPEINIVNIEYDGVY
jgi:hypothetical protein